MDFFLTTIFLPTAINSNWGSVFDLPAPDNNPNKRHVWLRVDYADGSSKKIALAPKRMGSNANALHVNLAFDKHPVHVVLYLENPNEDKVVLSAMDIPQLHSMDPPVIIGKKHGYEALK